MTTILIDLVHRTAYADKRTTCTLTSKTLTWTGWCKDEQILNAKDDTNKLRIHDDCLWIGCGDANEIREFVYNNTPMSEESSCIQIVLGTDHIYVHKGTPQPPTPTMFDYIKWMLDITTVHPLQRYNDNIVDVYSIKDLSNTLHCPFIAAGSGSSYIHKFIQTKPVPDAFEWTSVYDIYTSPQYDTIQF